MSKYMPRASMVFELLHQVDLLKKLVSHLPPKERETELAVAAGGYDTLSGELAPDLRFFPSRDVEAALDRFLDILLMADSALYRRMYDTCTDGMNSLMGKEGPQPIRRLYCGSPSVSGERLKQSLGRIS